MHATRWTLVLLAGALALLGNGPLQPADGEVTRRFTQAAERHVYELRTREDRQQVEIRLLASMQSGHITVRLLDPDGRTISAMAGGITGHPTGRLAVDTSEVRLVTGTPRNTGEARRGTWRAEVGLENASGSYALRYRGFATCDEVEAPSRH